MTEFHAFIKDFEAGHLDAQLTDKMSELVDAVTKFQKEGKLTIEISLCPKMEGEVLTSVKFKAKPPERDTIESIMFATPDNNLVDSNPKQPELFNQPVKSVKDAPASLVKNI
jgi:hypothetical protein